MGNEKAKHSPAASNFSTSSSLHLGHKHFESNVPGEVFCWVQSGMNAGLLVWYNTDASALHYV